MPSVPLSGRSCSLKVFTAILWRENHICSNFCVNGTEQHPQPEEMLPWHHQCHQELGALREQGAAAQAHQTLALGSHHPASQTGHICFSGSLKQLFLSAAAHQAHSRAPAINKPTLSEMIPLLTLKFCFWRQQEKKTRRCNSWLPLCNHPFFPPAYLISHM